MVEFTNTDEQYYLGKAKSYLPEGYVIVPIEPTEAMMDIYKEYHRAGKAYMDITIYKAMINEAQK